MIGKWISQSKTIFGSGLMAVASKKTYDITDAVPKIKNQDNLPLAPSNPYKKRPLKLVYDKNEYYTFRLPSEDNFLLGGFDREDIFGKRKGIEHSPHIRSQLDLDSNLVWIYFIFTFVALGLEFKYHDEFVVLRENFVNHDMGKFEYDDFK